MKILFSLLVVVLAAVACTRANKPLDSAQNEAATEAPVAGTAPKEAASGDWITMPSSLQYKDTQAGSGEAAQSGKMVAVHYTGWLGNNGDKGDKFDSSVDRGTPFIFPLGMGQVIPGWDEGVAGMKVGGKRTLRIPPKLGYGVQGVPGAIPPNSELIFDVELLEIK